MRYFAEMKSEYSQFASVSGEIEKIKPNNPKYKKELNWTNQNRMYVLSFHIDEMKFENIKIFRHMWNQWIAGNSVKKFE